MATASVSLLTWVLQFTVFPVSCQLIVPTTLALVVVLADLHTLMFTTAIVHGTRVDSDTRATVRMDLIARLAFTVKGSFGVDTTLLASSINHRTFINIFTIFPICCKFLSRWTFAVITTNGVTALALTTSIILGTFVHIVLTPRTLESFGTMTHLGDTFSTFASIETSADRAHRVQAAWLFILLVPSEAALIGGLQLYTVHLSIGSVVTSPSLVSNTPPMCSASLFPHFNHSCKGLHTGLSVSHHGQCLLCTHMGHIGLKFHCKSQSDGQTVKADQHDL